MDEFPSAVVEKYNNIAVDYIPQNFPFMWDDMDVSQNRGPH